MVEQRFCKPQVVGSSPFSSSIFEAGGFVVRVFGGEIPKWPKGSDCKSDGVCLRRFESFSLHHIKFSVVGEKLKRKVRE